jgi:hypothetical protein
MKLKTLLLGSAGALAVVGGAQAADLSVAEPVEYVKVCDAFGAGYWYIPGTDTCLKIGGLVRFEAKFHSAVNEYPVSVNGFQTLVHSAAWDFTTEARITVTAKSMTEYGPLTGYVELRAKSDNADRTNAAYGDRAGWSNLTGAQDITNGTALYGTKLAYLDSAWLELGPLLVGRAQSIYEYGAWYNFDFNDLDADAGGNDQVRLSWAMSGFGIQLGIEDPRDRWGTSLSSSYSMPDIVAAITVAQGHWDGKLSVGYGQTSAGSGFGVQAGLTIKLNEIAKGDKLGLKAAWAQSQVGGFAGAGVNPTGSVWMASASFLHFWSPTVSSAVGVTYQNRSWVTAGANRWQAAINLVWAPVTGFSAGGEVGWTKVDGSPDLWAAKIRVDRSW